MTTPLTKPLKRELLIQGRPFVVTLSPEGIKLTLKGKRKGQELLWTDLVSGEAALAVALNASLKTLPEAKAPPEADDGPSTPDRTSTRDRHSARDADLGAPAPAPTQAGKPSNTHRRAPAKKQPSTRPSNVKSRRTRRPGAR